MPGFLHSERVVYILLTATAILWGGNAVTAKYTVGELSPITTAFFRFAWVSIILIGVTLYIEGKKALPTVRQLPWLLALGMTGIFFNNFLFFYGGKVFYRRQRQPVGGGESCHHRGTVGPFSA